MAQDLNFLNIDIALIAETHLRSSIPDSYVTIPGYQAIRRDRLVCNCRRSGCPQPHKGGGVIIFYRSSLNIECFDSADNCESLWIKLTPAHSNCSFVFINVTYHPPNSDSTALMAYLSSTLDKILFDFPSGIVIIGGDFNRINLLDLETRFCLTTLDTPPTRGNVCLDLFLANKPHLIDSTSIFESTLKSDHLSVILTPHKRVPPHRTKVSFIDYSFKGFQKLNDSMNNTDFSNLFLISDTDSAANWLDETVSDIVTCAFPTRHVIMSDRDPLWLTPKCKYLMQKKKKAHHRNDYATCKTIDDKVLKQKLSFLKKNNTKIFWDKVNCVSNRKVSNKSISPSAFNGDHLNTELAQRSANTDHHISTKPFCFKPIAQNATNLPQLQLLEVAKTMSKCKRTSPGPTNIPFFMFRIFWDILAPLYLYVWNLSLCSGKFPSCYKRANLTPLPKTAKATKPDEIRGISVTPLSARLFEKLVHKKWILPNIVRLGDPLQFAYRPKVSTTDCLLTLQHYAISLLDQTNVDGVHIVTIDFSKAFDRLNQAIASHKFPKFTDHDILSQWLYDFSTNRSQRLIWEGKPYPFLNIDLGCSQGTVGGPNIFSIFTDDCTATLNTNKIIKYSDDSTLIVPCYLKPSESQASSITKEFDCVRTWSDSNRMTINSSKSHHLRFCLNHHPCCGCISPNLETRTNIDILGITFQSNCHFSNHVKRLLNFLRKTLYVIRDLKLNSFTQDKIDQVFDALILSRIRYGISVYGSDIHGINKIDNFLDSCFRHGHTSVKHSAHDILRHEDIRIAQNILQNPCHPLHNVLKQNTKQRTTRHNLTQIKPRTNTIAFSRVFCNRVLPL